MLKAIETYLTLRRATGFAMQNAECLLKSFAAFAVIRSEFRCSLGRPSRLGCPSRL